MPLLDRTEGDLRLALSSAAARVGWELGPEEAAVEIPRDPSHGELASAAAFSLAGVLKKSPREVAEALKKELEKEPLLQRVPLERVEIAGPGFLNFRMKPEWLENGLAEVFSEGADYGRSDRMAGEVILFEFVSANPTGPLNVVSARAAAVGDVLAALCEAAGARTGREFYVNDAGRQVQLLGISLEVRVRQQLGEDTQVPEDGYHGDYLVDMAARFVSEGLPSWWESTDGEERAGRLAQWAVEHVLELQQNALQGFGLQYDTWFRESSLYEEGAVDETLEELRSRGHIYDSEGAVWFRSTPFGDEKDRVLLTSDGRATYLLPDIAYHRNKYSRGWKTLVNLWGPDHHGYIARMHAALQALGHPEDSFRVLIVQQVNILRSGEVVKMSKRAGRTIEMEELVEEVGPDAARFFFLMRGTSTHLDFDLDLALSRNEENPVFYVQYAHARICSIMQKARKEGVDVEGGTYGADLSVLEAAEERTLLRTLVEFPCVVADAAQAFEPHRIPAYLRGLAAAFHPFYHNHRVVGATPALQAARLALCLGVRQVIANGLGLLGVSAPERM